VDFVSSLKSRGVFSKNRKAGIQIPDRGGVKRRPDGKGASDWSCSGIGERTTTKNWNNKGKGRNAGGQKKFDSRGRKNNLAVAEMGGDKIF